MGRKSQKARLEDARRCKDYLEEMTRSLGVTGRLSRVQIDSVGVILDNLRAGIHGRLGKREREVVRAAQHLMDKVDGILRGGKMSENERRAWARAMGTWKVIKEGLRPINRQAVKELIRYHDDNIS